MLEIKFGTDGWRAVIGETFTVSNVRRVAQAVCTLLREKEPRGERHARQTILVGHDWRFLSERFAVSAARVMNANGFKTRILSHAATSPMLSFAVQAAGARLGIMITASHNPPHFNGFKLKDSYGGPMEDGFIHAVEQRIGHDPVPLSSERLQETKVIQSYRDHLTRQVNLRRLKNSKIRIAIDSMHGPSAAVVDLLFGNCNPRLTLLRRERDPLFGGVNPEPIEKNLSLLQATVRQGRFAVGLAFDGDADRLGVIDDQGRYLPPHVVFPLLLLHAIENRKWSGTVVETVSMGYLPERIARRYEIPFQEVPVGFKYVSHIMRQKQVIAGGEESGGYGFGTCGAERDGILCGLLLLEYLTVQRKPLSQLADDLAARFGKSRFLRWDFRADRPVSDRAAWTESVSKKITHSKSGRKIKNINTLDGLKVTLEDGSWLLLRPSGTEPLIRLYSEAPELAQAEKLLQWGKEICGFSSVKRERPTKK
jgi:phosphomannomutase